MLTMIRVIVAGAAGAVTFSFAIYWWVRSSMSENANASRRARIAEVAMWLAMMALYAVTENGRAQKLIIALIAFVLAGWLFRGARFLLHKRTIA